MTSLHNAGGEEGEEREVIDLTGEIENWGEDLRPLSLAVFKNSGDRFYMRFKKMHDELIKTSLEPFDEDLVEEFTSSHDMEEKIRLVLRYWAGQITRPKKRRRNSTTLYSQAMALLSNPFIVLVCSILCMEQAWDWVQTEAGNRACKAEESEYWNTVSNDDRAFMWAQREGAMSTNEGQLSEMSILIIEKKFDELMDALEDGVAELEVE